MWLLHTEKIQLKWFSNPSEVSYAILSHVWGGDEQTFQDTPQIRSRGSVLHNARDRAFRRASQKIRNACARARHDGFRWLWIDTCCIDKTNSTELSEAINSMYAYYHQASMCYTLLHDVPSDEDPRAPNSAFRRSKWFTRGWTLQELIAPHSIIFCAQDWKTIGPKRSLADLIEEVTGIDRRVLTHKRPLDDVSVACRMSWAAGRKTSRVEDEAYSLMGIFGVYMPTIYGQGRHAFVRLQEEIIKKSPDQSIFAWGNALNDHRSGTFVVSAKEHDYAPQSQVETLLASSPADFAGCADIKPVPSRLFAEMLSLPETIPEYTNTSFGIRTTFPLFNVTRTPSVNADLALLACQDAKDRLIALYLRSDSQMRASNKHYVGGYIAQGGRRNHYYRATRLSLSEYRKLVAQYRQPSSSRARVAMQPSLKEVYIHSHIANPGRTCHPRRISTYSASSMIFFEPPCTVLLSKQSVDRLRKMGYIEPNIPEEGFRLEAPGDYRSISFLGYESFTVHLGVCPLDLSSTTQTAQLWASVRFDTEVDSLLEGEAVGDAGPSGAGDVHPDESMLVQSWKDARAIFGSRGKQVRLSFSYPFSVSDVTRKATWAEVYELEIRFEGHYSGGGGGPKCSRRATLTTTMSSLG